MIRGKDTKNVDHPLFKRLFLTRLLG